MDTVKQLILKPLKKKDVFFVLIEIEKDLKIALSRYLVLCRIGSCISSLSFVMSLMSILFYEDKAYYHATSVMSILLILAQSLTELSMSRKIRYLLYAGFFSNALFIWLFIIYLTSIMFIVDRANSASKTKFVEDIYFHVICLAVVGVTGACNTLAGFVIYKTVKCPRE